MEGGVGAAHADVRAEVTTGKARRLRAFREHLLAFPPLGWTVVFFVLPALIIILYSLGEIDPLTYQVRFGWTLDNYAQIWDGLYREAIVRSLLLAFASTVGCLLLGFPVAYFMALQESRLQRILLVAIIVPFWTSFIVRTYAWVNALADNGPLADLLRTVGLLEGRLGLLYTPFSVAIGLTTSYLPLMILPLYVALERMDPSLRNAAADLGANARRTFRRVIIPLAAPGIVAGCLMVGIPSTGEFVVPAILGGGKTTMYGNVVSDQFLKSGDYPFGAALAAAFMALLTIVLVLLRSRTRNLEELV